MLYAGLSWKSETFRAEVEAFMTGVFGGCGAVGNGKSFEKVYTGFR